MELAGLMQILEIIRHALLAVANFLVNTVHLPFPVQNVLFIIYIAVSLFLGFKIIKNGGIYALLLSAVFFYFLEMYGA